MKNGKTPDTNIIHPIAGYDKEIYVKPTVKNPNIIVGDFTYIADPDFESHVTHHYEWNGDKLIIGIFCQIASGVEFVMNGANHQMNAVTIFPFCTSGGSGLGNSAKNMQALAPGAKVLDGKRFSASASPDELKKWAEQF
jgi:virginiamycin A acetyltransferase